MTDRDASRGSTLSEVLLDRYRAGDAAATARLFVRLRRALVDEVRGHPCYAGLESTHSPEDVVSELWLKIFDTGAFGRFGDRGPGSLRAFLFRAVDCLLVDLHRRNAAQKRGPKPRALATGDSDSGAAMEPAAKEAGPRTVAGLLDWLERCAKTLRDDDAAVWRQRTVEGLGFDEIGERMHRSAAAVRGTFHRALKQLEAAGLLEQW